ncbi:class I adenylate-forming enzyme family protein [Dactylosporangium sp. NPDC005572]|uniref:class I adenylate-forming enzyme family protein n=1 Tax=Dactylosporangium sp. NPDC005572 TaxID=3156889 RepID=UPI0033AD74FD
MGYAELTPEALLSAGFEAPEVTGGAWHVSWDGAAAGLVDRLVPETVAFHTSGTTGPRRAWWRTREQLWTEAGLLADLLGGAEAPRAVVSFVPPVHIYGALATVLVPARLGVPVWYRSGFFGAMPAVGGRAVVVAATPWIFTLLLQHLDWVRGFDRVVVLHSSAMLPATAGRFLAEAGADRAEIVEVLGSTETGGIAARRWAGGEPPPWTLLPDVDLVPAGADEQAAVPGEVPLVVRSPRLAFGAGERPPATRRTGDHVEPVGPRGFRFAGRRDRLVKVNGRRIDLDEVERGIRPLLDAADLALAPVADPMIGEHLDLLLVLRPGTTLAGLDLAAAIAAIGVRPRRVRVLPRIERSPTGKLRAEQPDPL